MKTKEYILNIDIMEAIIIQSDGFPRKKHYEEAQIISQALQY